MVAKNGHIHFMFHSPPPPPPGRWIRYWNNSRFINCPTILVTQVGVYGNYTISLKIHDLNLYADVYQITVLCNQNYPMLTKNQGFEFFRNVAQL